MLLIVGTDYFIFYTVSQGEDESFISAMKQSPARYPLKYFICGY